MHLRAIRRSLLVAPVLAVVLSIALVAGATTTLYVWSTPSTQGDTSQRSPRSVVVSENGDAALITSVPGGLRAQVRRAGVWSPTSVLPTSSALVFSTATTSDAQGRFYVAWVGRDVGAGTSSLFVAVSQPGSTNWDGPYMVSGAAYDSINIASIAVDGSGRVVTAATVSNDHDVTHAIEVRRCDFTAAPLCEVPYARAGASSLWAFVLVPDASTTTIAWMSDTGAVTVADLGPSSLGSSTVVASSTSGPSWIKGWAGAGTIELAYGDSGVEQRLVHGTSGWSAPAPQSRYLSDVAFAPGGVMEQLETDGTGLLFEVTTTDNVTFSATHQLSTTGVAGMIPPSIGLASDGALVAVWGEFTGLPVVSAVRVGGVWQPNQSIGTYAQCGGEPLMAASSVGGAVAAWGRSTAPFAVEISEMALELPTTTTTSSTSTTSTTIGDLVPSFAC